MFFSTEVDVIKKQMKYISGRFPNVVNQHEVPDMMDEVASLRACERLKELVTIISPVEFFSRLQTWKDKRYEVIVRLGGALLTNHGTGSNSERDFSLMNWLLADKSTHNTNQERLEARLGLKSYNNNLKYHCNKCKDLKEKKLVDEELNIEDRDDISESEDGYCEEDGVKKANKLPYHCHCYQFKVSNELLVHMADGKPGQRYKEKEKKKQDAAKVEEILMKNRRQEDKVKIDNDMKTEVQKLKKVLREKKKDEVRKEKEKDGQTTETADEKKDRERKERKLKRKKIEQEREAKKQKLSILFS